VKEETSRVGVTEQNKLLVTCLVVEYPRALAAAVACRNGGMVCAASRGVALDFFFRSPACAAAVTRQHSEWQRHGGRRRATVERRRESDLWPG
jgi:hypothetical protein